MWRRILSFLGWLWAGFFILVGIAGFVQNPAFALTSIVWGLVFLPPLFRLTSSYGLGWNVGGRVAALFISLMIGAALSPPEPQLTQSTPPVDASPAGIKDTESSASIANPTPTFIPIAKPTPTLEPDIAPSPKVIETSEPKPATAPVEPQPIPTPEVIETPKPEPPQNIPERTSKPASQPQANPDAPVRAAVSGSCDCPYDTDRRGRSCGKRSAYSRPGGRSPVCYVRDQQ